MISVIIPIHNAEKYLNSCIDSILSQKGSEIELLLINDGSTDKSREICDEYANKDCRVRVFHKENAGVGPARNLGIEQATGEYIHFVDADDIVLTGAYEYLTNAIQKYSEPDIICFKNLRNKVEPAHNVIGDEKYYSHIHIGVKENVILSTLWCKVFKRRFILKANIRFIPINYSQDVDFVWNLLRHDGTLVISPACLYSYSTTPNSAVNNRNIEHVTKSVDALIQLNLRLKEYSASYSDCPFVIEAFTHKYRILFNRILCIPYKHNELKGIFKRCEVIGIDHLYINNWIKFFDFCYQHPSFYYVAQKLILKIYFFCHRFQHKDRNFIEKRLCR